MISFEKQSFPFWQSPIYLFFLWPPIFSSKSLIELLLTFMPLIYFELICTHGVRWGSTFIFSPVDTQWFQHHLMKRPVFLPWTDDPFQKLVDCRHGGLFRSFAFDLWLPLCSHPQAQTCSHSYLEKYQEGNQANVFSFFKKPSHLCKNIFCLQVPFEHTESKWSLIYREMKVFSVIYFWSQFYKSFFCFDFEYHVFSLFKYQTVKEPKLFISYQIPGYCEEIMRWWI